MYYFEYAGQNKSKCGTNKNILLTLLISKWLTKARQEFCQTCQTVLSQKTIIVFESSQQLLK